MTLAYRLLAWFRGLPQDRIADLVLFGSSVFLLGLAYVIGRYSWREPTETTIERINDPGGAQETALRVEILSPLDGSDLGRQTVRGSVFPPDSTVQALVLAPNGLWYLQGPVEVKGRAWSCKCQFGVEGKPGNSYDVVAVHGKALRLPKYEREHLPNGIIKSNVIRVHRRSNEVESDTSEIREDYRSRMDKVKSLSEVIARGDQLVRVFKARGLIPREHIDIWTVDIREALSHCYGKSGISKFYHDERAEAIKPIPGGKEEDLHDWFDFHQRRLAELVFEERYQREPEDITLRLDKNRPNQ